MIALRLTSSLVIAAVLTGLLFLLMNALVQFEAPTVSETTEPARIGFTPLSEPPPPVESKPRDEPPPQAAPSTPSIPVAIEPAPTGRPDFQVGPSPGVPTADLLISLRPPGPGAGAGVADREPRIITQIAPQYPADQVMRGVEGFVKVRFVIDARGQLTQLEVLEARPNRAFASAVVRALQKWSFAPAMRNGDPIAMQVSREFVFTLD